MGDEVFCLSCAGAAVRVCEMVTAADEAGVCGAGVVAREGRVNVVSAFGCLVAYQFDGPLC